MLRKLKENLRKKYCGGNGQALNRSRARPAIYVALPPGMEYTELTILETLELFSMSNHLPFTENTISKHVLGGLVGRIGSDACNKQSMRVHFRVNNFRTLEEHNIHGFCFECIRSIEIIAKLKHLYVNSKAKGLMI